MIVGKWQLPLQAEGKCFNETLEGIGRSINQSITTLTVWTLLAGLVLNSTWSTKPASAEEIQSRLTILHTNDLLGRLNPGQNFDEPSGGGFARLAYLINEQRKSGIDASLLVDGGDAIGDSPIASADAGKLVVRLMNAMGYDAMVVGNHEFDYGIDSLRIRSKEANFSMLGANVMSAVDSTALFPPFALVDRGDMQVAVIGLLSPDALRVINPIKTPGLAIENPQWVLRSLLEGPAGQADLKVVLVHMSFPEARNLFRNFPEIDLWIAGGFSHGPGKGVHEHAVRFSDGGYLVTTPGRGAFLGRVDLVLRREEDEVALVEVRPDLIPVDARVPKDREVAVLIDGQQKALERDQRQVIGSTGSPIEDTAQWAADLIRTRLNTEVAIINQGTLRSLTLDGDVHRGTLDRLVRYDDVLVCVEVKGSQLSTMSDSSAKRTRQGQRLVFSGYDTQAGLIGSRPLVAEEKYLVATTSFLAAGGDDYWPRTKSWDLAPAGWITLRQLLEEHFRLYPDFRRRDGVSHGGRSVWKNSTKLNAALSHTSLDASASRYRGVTFLGGRDALAWNGQLESRTSYESHRGTMAVLIRSAFGQLRTRSRLREAVDRLNGEWLYTWAQRQPAPFIGLDINTVWTAVSGEKHPLALRFKGGVHKAVGRKAGVGIGLALERDRSRSDSVLGVELAPKFRSTLGRGNSLSSQTKLFLGANRGRAISIQNFNGMRIRLHGNLAATIDANLFFHREDKVGQLAAKSELLVGIAYTWSEKWL